METVILVQTYKGEGGVDRENDMSLEDIPLTLKVTRRRRLEDEARYINFKCELMYMFIHIDTDIKFLGCCLICYRDFVILEM